MYLRAQVAVDANEIDAEKAWRLRLCTSCTQDKHLQVVMYLLNIHVSQQKNW